MVKNLAVLGMALGLAACASAPAAKPQLTQQGYDAFAKHLMVVNYCAQQGMITPQVGASGNRYLKSQLSGYDFNEAQLKTALSDFVKAGLTPSQGDCNTVAMQISELEQQRAANIAQSQADAQEMQALTQQLNTAVPKPIYCNKIGTQTFCN